MNELEYLYLDHAATTPMREIAFEAFKHAEEVAFANSSGGHELSRRAKNLLEESRDLIAGIFGAAPKEITFTSGGTEADNWIIKSPFLNNAPIFSGLVTTQIEHEAVLGSAEWIQEKGFEVKFVSVNEDGVVDVDEFIKSCNKETLVASLMYANNETGVIQPISEI